MKKPMSQKKAIAIFTPCITAVLAIMIALIIAATMFWEDISLFLYGRSQTVDAAVLANGEMLCEDIVEEGTVLLKNEEDENGPALPLSAEELKKVNVFGWAAYDWMTMAFGSGYANTDLQKIKFFPALEEAGIEYNEDLYRLYQNFYTAHSMTYGEQDLLEYRGGVSFGSEEIFVLREPSKQDYLALSDSIRNFSKVGIVVIGRTGSESKDLELKQVKQTTAGTNNKTTDNSRHYLELSTEEEDMISVATELCDKVIVILNTANTMETGFLDNDKIDGALLVGITGLTGVRGLVNVLRGYKDAPVPVLDKDGAPTYDENGAAIYEKNADGTVKTERVKVSPSGRTVDTYAYDILGTTPSAINQGDKGAGEAGAGTIYANCKSEDSRYRAYVDYSEGIYVGYKWFETANAEGFWSDVHNEYGDGYEGVVQWPFGYGLSYTDFSWTVKDVKVGGTSKRSGELQKDDTLVFTVEVKNLAPEGGFPAADVVELYYTAPYIEGGIEKSSVVLGAFAKTKVLQPQESVTVTLELPVQQMASYDCYDLNKNGHTSYELDAGEYTVALMKNSHEIKSAETVFTYTMSETCYDKDLKTGNAVENRFTNPDGNGNDKTIDESDLDGSHEETPVKYLSRADFKATYPQKIASPRNRTQDAERVSKQVNPTQAQLEYAGYGKGNDARTTAKNGLTFEDVLGTDDYDDPIWATLIANITDAELFNLVQDGYFKTAAIESIGKVQFVDLDGPLGFNTRVTGGNGTTCMFMAYPSGTMLAQTWSEELAYAYGLSVGMERTSMDGLRGWYAPGANLHRNPFGGRNGEYYSEDALLSGYICAGTVRGAKDMGVYSYVKHFAVNDSEYNREGLFTFLTEQALRENYLRPFEIMIKVGGGNALMTAMNRLGRVWTGANYGLVTEIARGEWGFEGTIVTDWMNSNESYMAPYRGIWAGNDIWLTNGLTAPAFDSMKGDPTAAKIAENVAHDVLWTLVDTFNAEQAHDPNAQIDINGASYNMTWIWYIVLVEVALAAGVAVMAYFLVRAIVRNKKAADGAPADETAPDETHQD